MNSRVNKWKVQLVSALFMIIFLSFSGYTQSLDTSFENLDRKLELLASHAPREVLYIQTSKNIYETGEDLWFKVYVLNSQTLVPSPLSRTLYLQVFNENTKKVTWEEMYPIQNGFANCHVFLPDSLAEGNYMLAAFTPRSFVADSSELKAVRRIQVRKDMKPRYEYPEDKKKKTTGSRNVQFNTFPEGGNLVAEIQCNLAFKAVNDKGLPLEVEGTLFEDSVPLVLFKSEHAGMGVLRFIPHASKRYHIRLTQPALDSAFCVPHIYPQGIVMGVTTRDRENMEVTVAASPGMEPQTVYLQAQVRGIVYSSASAILKNKLIVKIPVNDFPCQGIAEFTLFNQKMEPIAERLVYANPEKKLNIQALLDKEYYQTRGKAVLKIKVTDQNGQPVTANCGVTVYDKLYHNPADPDNILTHCYLFSQLKGKIYDPWYYFDTTNTDRETALDLLLLTQGWRKYVWNMSVMNNYEKRQPAIIFDGIEGEVYATRMKKKAIGKRQYILAYNPSLNLNKNWILSETSGKFFVSASQLKLWQGNYIYLKPDAPEKYKSHINMSNPFQSITKFLNKIEINYPISYINTNKELLSETPFIVGHNRIKLSEVTINGTGEKRIQDKYLGHLDSLAKLDFCEDYVCSSGYLNCEIHKNSKDNTKPIEGKTYKQYVGFTWLNNGAYTIDREATIKYYYPKFTENDLLKKYNLTRIKAYYTQREFYKPNYDTITVEDPMPDFRNTLLWEPSVVTDKNGEASLEFFCSDINTGFTGSIEGVSNEGLLGMQRFEFSVIRRKDK